MKTILESHLNFIKNNGWIEFENFFSAKSQAILSLEIKNILANTSSEKYSYRDIFRKSKILCKNILSRDTAELLKKISGENQLRLLYDQLLSPAYPLPEYFSLADISSFQGLTLGILMSYNRQTALLKPLVRIFSANHIIDRKELDFEKDIYYLIAVGKIKSIYKENTNDPATHFLKSLGLGYNDSLKAPVHPIIY